MTISTDDYLFSYFVFISHCYKSSFTKIPNKNRSDAFNLWQLRNPTLVPKALLLLLWPWGPLAQGLTLGPDCPPPTREVRNQSERKATGQNTLSQRSMIQRQLWHLPNQGDWADQDTCAQEGGDGCDAHCMGPPFPSVRAKLELCLLMFRDSQLNIGISLKWSWQIYLIYLDSLNVQCEVNLEVINEAQKFSSNFFFPLQCEHTKATLFSHGFLIM